MNETGKNEDKKPPSLDLVFQEVKDRLDKQFEQIEILTTRAAFIMGFASLVLTSLLSIKSAMGSLACYEFFLIAIAVIVYIIVLVFSFLAYALVDYRRDPEPKPLRDKYLRNL